MAIKHVELFVKHTVKSSRITKYLHAHLLLPVVEDDGELKHVVSVLHDPGEPLPAGPQLLVAHLHHVQGIVS